MTDLHEHLCLLTERSPKRIFAFKKKAKSEHTRFCRELFQRPAQLHQGTSQHPGIRWPSVPAVAVSLCAVSQFILCICLQDVFPKVIAASPSAISTSECVLGTLSFWMAGETGRPDRVCIVRQHWRWPCFPSHHLLLGVLVLKYVGTALRLTQLMPARAAFLIQRPKIVKLRVPAVVVFISRAA